MVSHIKTQHTHSTQSHLHNTCTCGHVCTTLLCTEKHTTQMHHTQPYPHHMTPYPHHMYTIPTPHVHHTLTTCTPYPHHMCTIPSTHVHCTHTTCTPYPHHMYTIPSPHVHHTLTTCTPYPHHMYTIPSPHVHCIHTTCTPYPHHMYTIPSPHVHHTLTTCTPYPHHMYTIPSPHVHHNSHLLLTGTKPEHFAKIAWKNHRHSVNNPYVCMFVVVCCCPPHIWYVYVSGTCVALCTMYYTSLHCSKHEVVCCKEHLLRSMS